MTFFTTLTLLQALLIAVGACLSLALFYQDLRKRTVHLYLLIGLMTTGTAFHLTQNDQLDQACPLLLQDLAANLIFITTILGIAYIYMRIRHKTHTTFQKQLGLGDILYFVAVAPWFSPIQFILFFISGILLTLLAIVIFLALRKIPKDWPIPLAGVLAAYWLFFLPFAEILEVLVLKKFGI